MINALGYIGLRSAALDEWQSFATEMLGMQVERNGSDRLSLRMDDKKHRYLIRQSDETGLDFIAFEVDSAASLEAVKELLEGRDIAIQSGTQTECQERAVTDFIWVRDPDNHRVEFFVGLQEGATPFVSGKPIGGFRTGELGLGHLVLNTPNFKAMDAFYRELLGFKLSDYHHEPFAAEFLHINARHHSLALIGGTGAPSIHHVMCEYVHFDDVGRAYDIALDDPEQIAVSLGRHMNDHVISFYARTPDQFFIEIGWAGRLINDATWQPQELDSPSLWGHIRYWLPEERRAKARVQIRALAERGVRFPVETNPSDGFAFPEKEQ